MLMGRIKPVNCDKVEPKHKCFDHCRHNDDCGGYPLKCAWGLTDANHRKLDDTVAIVEKLNALKDSTILTV